MDQLRGLVTRAVSSGSFCDPFGGIGTVGAHFKAQGFRVTAGDNLNFAHFFQVARIGTSRALRFDKLPLLDKTARAVQLTTFLNRLPPATSGMFVEQYSRTRRFFTNANASRIQAAWNTIRDWWFSGQLSEKELAVLMASLIDSMDRVANTAGTYYAYLKKWYRKALRPFEFRMISPTPGPPSVCILCNAIDLIRDSRYDVVYLDPPYNDRCYAGYYHLPESIVTFRSLEGVRGLAGMPNVPIQRSDFYNRGTAAPALEQILDAARFKLLILHYSDDGVIPRSEILTMLKTLGRVRELTLQTRKYNTDSGGMRKTCHRIYLVHNA